MTKPHCDLCGKPHPRCDGHRKEHTADQETRRQERFGDRPNFEARPIVAANSEPCGRYPVKGSNVCRQCGASAPQVRRAADDAVRRQAAEKATRRLAVPVLGTDHLQALQDALDLSHGILDALVDLVNTLDLDVGDDPTGTSGIAGRTYHESGMPTGEAKPHIYVTLLNEERDRYAKLSIECAKLGIEERRTQVAERATHAQVAELADMLTRALTAIPAEYADLVKGALARELKAKVGDGLAARTPRAARAEPVPR